MLPLLGASPSASAPAIHTATFVLQDYLPAGVVGLVVLVLAAAIVLVAVRRSDTH